MAASRRVTDDCRREVELPDTVARVVSLCPSISETIAHLAPEVLVGRTRYCIHPAAQMQDVMTVGGTKNPDVDAVLALKPDLVIAEKEENRAEDVARLARQLPVYVFDVQDLAGAAAMVSQMGVLMDAPGPAAQLVAAMDTAGKALHPIPERGSALYLIWRKPWMGAARGTYIDAVLTRLGFRNLLADQTRYPELDMVQLRARHPQFVLLSSEPYPFTTAHVAEVQKLFPEATVLCVDGELFSWYGVRTPEALTRLPAWLDARLPQHR